MNKLWGMFFILFFSVTVWGQVSTLGKAGEALVKAGGKGLSSSAVKAIQRELSSKVMATRYMLTAQSVQLFQQTHLQQVDALLGNLSLPVEARMKELETLKLDAAQALATFNSQLEQEYAQWGAVLLRERNPHFLPPKDKNIPGLLAESPLPEKYPSITPRTFRKWMDRVAEVEGLPQDASVMFDGLRRQLLAQDLEFTQTVEAYTKARSKLNPAGEYKVNQYYRKKMRLAGRKLYRLSKSSAQTVVDIVSLMNLYQPSFEVPLYSLSQLVSSSLQTEFTSYLKKMLPPTNIQQIGFIGTYTPHPKGIEFVLPR